MLGVGSLGISVLALVIIIVIVSFNWFQTEQLAPVRVASLPDDYGRRAADNSWPPLERVASSLAKDLVQTNYYLVLDGSGSMRDVDCSGSRTKMEVAKESLVRFIDQIPDAANVGLYLFDREDMSERIPLGPGRRADLRRAIQTALADGGTPLSSAIETGYRSLTAQALRQLGYGEFHMVVVTDGSASSGYEPDHVVDRILAKSPVVLHTIGFCISGDHSLNQPDRSYYRQANNPDELTRGLDAVLAEEPSFAVSEFVGSGG